MLFKGADTPACSLVQNTYYWQVPHTIQKILKYPQKPIMLFYGSRRVITNFYIFYFLKWIDEEKWLKLWHLRVKSCTRAQDYSCAIVLKECPPQKMIILYDRDEPEKCCVWQHKGGLTDGGQMSARRSHFNMFEPTLKPLLGTVVLWL